MSRGTVKRITQQERAAAQRTCVFCFREFVPNTHSRKTLRTQKHCSQACTVRARALWNNRLVRGEASK